MRVLVCGGRDFGDYPMLSEVLFGLNDLYGISTIVHGDARGADRLGGSWAKANGIAEDKHPADWDKHGKSAGYIRNAEMVNSKPDIVVVMPGGKGTENTLKLSLKAGIKTINLMEEKV